MRSTPPPIHPIYSLKRTELGPGEFSYTPLGLTGVHPSFHTYHQLNVMKDVKESCLRCNMINPSDAQPLDCSAWDSELPDRSTVDVAWERLHLPELYFNPNALRAYPSPTLSAGAEGGGLSPKMAELVASCPDNIVSLPEMVSETIRGCDTDMRRELWGGIVVSGGGSLLPGLTERLHGRLNELVPQMSMKVKLLAPTTPQERHFSVWIGGSILASLGSFQQLWLSKQEYDEFGPSAIQRKCP